MPELHLAAIFCEKKSETVAKHRVTQSKITLFWLEIPKMAGFWEKSGIFAYFGVLGLSGLRILLSYFWPAQLRRPKQKKSTQIFFLTANGSKPPAKPRFIEIEIEKSRFLIEKKSTPNYPEICYVVPGPLQRRAAAERIGAPPNARQFEKIEKKKKCRNCHLAAIFCEKKSETVAKHRVTQSTRDIPYSRGHCSATCTQCGVL